MLDSTTLPSSPSQYESIRPLVHRHYPAKWALDTLGPRQGFLWSKQIEIMESVRDNRRTAVMTCHAGGKSHVASRIAGWWIGTHDAGDAGVLTSAPSNPQVKRILWKYIARVHSTGNLPGRLNQVEWWLNVPDYDANGNYVGSHEEMVAVGRKPSDYNPDAFQGDHPRYMLVIFDEACGMHTELCDSADSLISNRYSRFLMIGNPTDPTSEFAAICKPGSGWNVIQIGYRDTPNFTDEIVPQEVSDGLISPVWVEEKKRSWGEDNPRYIARVEGKFPDSAISGLIPISWVERALVIDLASSLPNELGVDVGAGGDRNVIAHRLGPCVSIILRNHEPNTMTSLGNVVDAIKSTGATRTKVDYIGVGQGIVDRAREIAMEARARRNAARYRLYNSIVGVRVSSRACDTEKFHNLRAEGFYNLRNRLECEQLSILPGPIHGSSDDVAAQLCALQRKPTSSGRELLVDKRTLKQESGLEMDEVDAVMLAFLDSLPIIGKMKRKARAVGFVRR